jgi:hypothetical protein
VMAFCPRVYVRGRSSAVAGTCFGVVNLACIV